jgi:hypothetical protein
MAKRFVLFIACAIVMALSGTAAAQFMPGINLNTDRPSLAPEEQEKRKAVDDAYKSAIKKLPDKKESDPWGNLRSTATPQSKQR